MKTTARAKGRRAKGPAGRSEAGASWEAHVLKFGEHLALKGRSPRTQINYLGALRKLAAWWEASGGDGRGLSPGLVTEYTLAQFKEHLLREAPGRDCRSGAERRAGIERPTGQGPASVNLALSAVRSFLRWAIRQGLAKEVPEVEPVRRSPPEALWLDRVERNRLLRVASESRNPRDLAILELLLNTGLRVSELCSLRWRDLDWSRNKGELTVRGGKGGKWRTVPLNKAARGALRSLREIAGEPGPTELVLRSRENDSLSPRTVQHLVKVYGDAARIPNLHPHRLRHSFARSLAEGGTDVATIARIMGHSSIQTAMIYITASEKTMRAAVERLDD